MQTISGETELYSKEAICQESQKEEEEWGTEKPLPESSNSHSSPKSNTCFHKVGCY